MSDSKIEQTNEKVSAFFDDEQTLDNTLFDSLTSDNDIKAKWARYNLVSDVLNERDHHHVDKSWFSNLSAKIDKEPTVLAPRVSRTFTQKVVKQVSGFAVAATVAAVAILSVQQVQFADNQETVNFASGINQLPVNSNAIRPVTLRLNKAKESRLSGYLVNHYEYSMTGKMQGMMPYMRIVSVTPAERIVHEK